MPQANVQLVQNEESDKSGDVLGILVMSGIVKEMGCRMDMSKHVGVFGVSSMCLLSDGRFAIVHLNMHGDAHFAAIAIGSNPLEAVALSRASCRWPHVNDVKWRVDSGGRLRITHQSVYEHFGVLDASFSSAECVRRAREMVRSNSVRLLRRIARDGKLYTRKEFELWYSMDGPLVIRRWEEAESCDHLANRLSLLLSAQIIGRPD